MGVLTYNPGGKNLFEAFMLGIPLCPRGTGEHLKDSIVEVVDEFIEPSQYTGFSGDGVYPHCGVPEKLNDYYHQRGIFTYDLMHLAALVDIHMRNTKKSHSAEFAWLNTLTQDITLSIQFIQ